MLVPLVGLVLPAQLQLMLVMHAGRPCLSLVYRTQKELYDTLLYLDKCRQQKANPPASLNLQRLRLGLELIRKHVDKSDYGNDTLLDIVFALHPEEIQIPRQCWEDAGTIKRIYPDASKPLSQQLEELSKAVWRMTTLVQETAGGATSGNHYVPFLAAVLVTVPCLLLEKVLLMDLIGYIVGDTACEEAHSQVSEGLATSIVGLNDHLPVYL